MKYYISPANQLFGYEADGSQDSLIPSSFTLATKEQIDAIQNPPQQVIIPTSITMKQARLALLDAGLLDAVMAGVAAMPRAAQIEWEFSSTVDRGNPLVAALAQALNLSAIALDALFKKGSTFT